jgi:peroxiredoxin Q/BCP
MSNWLTVGKQIPNLTLAADDGSQVRLADLRGKAVVIYLQRHAGKPRREASRPSCGLKKLGVAVFGVSPDNVKSRGSSASSAQLSAAGRHQPRRGRDLRALARKNMYGKKYMGFNARRFDAEGRLRQVWQKVNVDEPRKDEAVKAIGGGCAGAV